MIYFCGTIVRTFCHLFKFVWFNFKSSINIDPLLGFNKPIILSTNVDFPDPVCPKIPIFFPNGISMFTSNIPFDLFPDK